MKRSSTLVLIAVAVAVAVAVFRNSEPETPEEWVPVTPS